MVFLLYSVLLSLLIGVRKFQSQSKQSSFHIKNDIFQESKCQTIPGLSFGDNHLKAFMGPEVRIFARHVIEDRTISIIDYSTLTFFSPSSFYCIRYHFFCPTRTEWPRQSQLSANNSPFAAGSNQISQDGVR